VLDPPGLVASGRDGRVDGAFTASFADLPKPRLSEKPSLKTPRPLPWYVRVIPVSGGDPPLVIGQPSNLVRVFDTEVPPAPPAEVNVRQVLKPAAKLSLIRVQYKPHWAEVRWPPGCRTEPPPDKSIFEQAWDSVTSVWSGVTEAYEKAKSLVVDLASTLTGGVIPRSVLNFALTTALVAAGVPPDIPNLDQLMSEGADYLAAAVAEQVIGPAADEVISGLAKQYNLDPNLGPEQLKQAVTEKMRDTSRQAVLEGAAAARRPAGGDGLCQGRLHPAQMTLTVRNVDPAGNRITTIWVEYEGELYEEKRLGVVIEPGETLTIPVPLLPKTLQKYKSSQMPSYDHAANVDYWWDLYWTKPGRFVVKSSGGEQCFAVDDGLIGCRPVSGGILYTSPSQLMDRTFDDQTPKVSVNPGGQV
jgi:hypothetical protein